jgi:predicted ATPase
LSLYEVLDNLHNHFRLLTGGALTAGRRQQTLRASVDWSHVLPTEPEASLSFVKRFGSGGRREFWPRRLGDGLSGLCR